MADVGAGAGLSRGAPGYFFGSKEALYAAVLARAFDERDAALRPAFDGLAAWDGATPVEDPLAAAVAAYLGFLHANPQFVALVEREALDGTGRLARTPHASSAVAGALAALRGRHGLLEFDVAEVLVALVSLCFFPLAHRTTFLPAAGVDPEAPGFLERRRDAVVAALLPMIR